MEVGIETNHVAEVGLHDYSFELLREAVEKNQMLLEWQTTIIRPSWLRDERNRSYI
jgi:hypothetical protein